EPSAARARRRADGQPRRRARAGGDRPAPRDLPRVGGGAAPRQPRRVRARAVPQRARPRRRQPRRGLDDERRAAVSGVRVLRMMVARSLRQHALSTLVTVFSVALASGLVLSVYAIQQQARDAFTSGPTGFNAALGARGSQLQLVLNTVFHL